MNKDVLLYSERKQGHYAREYGAKEETFLCSMFKGATKPLG